jgi:hypothetical protein
MRGDGRQKLKDHVQFIDEGLAGVGALQPGKASVVPRRAYLSLMCRMSLFRIAKTLSEMGFLRYDDGSKIFSRHSCAFWVFSFTGVGCVNFPTPSGEPLA